MKLTLGVAAAALLSLSAAALAQETSCRQEVGAARARVLVEQCRQVSPATHPPCNAANPCALIVDEIKRGCGFFTPGSSPPAPRFCARYAR